MTSFSHTGLSRAAARSWQALPFLAVVACSPPPSSSPPNAVVIGTTRDFESVNELVAVGSAFNDAVIDRLFLSLLQERDDFSDHPPTFAPRLAESYEFSDDRLTLTFHLRPDIRWSDGVPITAEDVRWTWQAQVHEEIAWVYSFSKEAISDVEVVDPHTIRFHFTEVSTSQLVDANEGVILPKHAWSELPFDQWRDRPDWFVDNLVSSGPFVLHSWKRQQQIELRRNEAYYEPGLPRLDRVMFRIVPDQANLVNQLIAGSIDMAQTIAPADAARIEAAGHARLLPHATRQYTFICWNTQRPQFESAQVRQALAMAIDRATIVDTVWRGFARIAVSPIVSTAWAHNPDIKPWAHDPKSAAEILERHGWRDSDDDGILDRNGIPFVFELTTNPGNQERWDAMVMIKQQLGKIGIEVRPRLLEYNTLNAKNANHDFDATVIGVLMDTTMDLEYGFHSRAIDNGLNYGSFTNQEVDRLIDEVNQQTDPEAIRPLLYRIQQIVHEKQPFLFLWEPQRLAAVSKSLENVRPNSQSDFDNLREWSLKQPDSRDPR